MKKRILALALAGTTAFSVFGAAMSASAIQQTPEATVTLANGKTVYYYTDDAYLPYENVAKTITTENAISATATQYYYDSLTTGVSKAEKVFKEVLENLAAGKDANNNDTIWDEGGWEDHLGKMTFRDSYNLLYAKDAKYNNDTGIAGATEPDCTFTIDKNGNFYDRVQNAIVTDESTIKKFAAAFGIFPAEAYGESTGKWIWDKEKDTSLSAAEASTEKVIFTDVKDALKAAFNTDESLPYPNNIKGGYDTTLDAYKALPADDADDYTEKYRKPIGTYTAADDNGSPAKVIVNNGNKLNGGTAIAEYDANGKDIAKTVVAQTNWTFTAQDTSAEVSPYTLDSKSYLNADKTGYYIVTTAEDNNTIYAYDFIPAANGNIANANASSIAWNWNYGTTTATAAAFGSDWIAEEGRGTYGVGVRYGVVSDWLDFLDELGINHDGGYHYVENFEEFKQNYWDLFYLDNVYDRNTGLLAGKEYVDLYNIQELLHDIYEYSYKAAWSEANTSELVYLMQQYNKYIGNYISPSEVTNDDWGDLLLSILDAATEADFKSSKEYKKYTNKVSSLRDAYEEATTSTQIYNAEAEMYDLLTNYGSYGYKAKGDFADARKELGAAINGLYFNATTKSSTGNVIDTYSVEAATQDKTYAEYTNYEYLVAASKTSYTGNTSSVTFSVNRAAGYYSLYPMADYIDWDTTTPNEAYAGNASATDFNGYYATEEYEWFWNVYQLAANMYNNISTKGNHYAGSIEAVIEALADAVDGMDTLTTASKTATAAVDELKETYGEKLQGFVKTGEVSKEDFNEGYYSKYEEALAYADVFTGKSQAQVAANILEVSGKALTYQGTQTVVTKNDMKAIETAISDGEKALKALVGEEYNAAQVNALNKAVSQAKNLLALYRGEYSTVASNQSVDYTYTTTVRDKDQMLKSDLAEAIAAIDDAINYSEIVMGWSKNDAGKWMYGTEDGYLNNGWNKIGSVWYYFNEDGTAKQSEWMQEDGKWYWFNSNAGAAIGWAKVDGQWYYFGGNNAMKTGWQKVDGSWYYLASSGRMITGWAQVDGKWYYMSKESNSLGQMLANTTTPDGYKVGADGAMLTK